jgi:hypothetical protein
MSATRDPFSRQLLLGFGIIFAAIIGAAIAIYFILSDVRARASVIAGSQTKVAIRNGDLAALASLQADAPRAASYAAAITKLLRPRDSLIQFPHQVQSLAASYNVIAEVSFTNEPSTPAPGVAGVATFSLNASGKSDDLLAFLKNIETQSSQFLVAVDTLDFSPNASNGRLAASGRVFFQ